MTRELTDEQINAIWGARDDPMFKSTLSAFGMDRIRAIIKADRALRVPMTDAQTEAAKTMASKANHDPHIVSFMLGIEAAEAHHGIVGEKGGA